MKRITIILGVLLVLLLVIKLKDRKQGDRSFKEFIVEVDTAKVDNIKIHMKSGGDILELTKENAAWMMKIDGKKVQADEGTIYDLLSQVHQLKPKQVVATSKDKWATYEVGDSLGSRVEIRSGKKNLADFVIGKFSYSQPQGQNPQMQQRQNIIMTSYVRNSDEDHVFAVDGYLSMMFNRDSKSFRNNTLISGNPKSWNKLVYTYPDSSFTLVKQNEKWMADGILADSAKVATYLSQISKLSNTEFDDESIMNDKQKSTYSVRIEGDNFKPIEINGLQNNMGEIVYKSSQNKGNLFKSDNIKDALFVNKEHFMN
ncbi:MAG: DUF4340 domain-containing protein [Salinivirgaceae bacterium]|nr:DUF4340 domain-containing protein [Salinivirgaceae bacterium]